jgi:hypothetical protein
LFASGGCGNPSKRELVAGQIAVVESLLNSMRTICTEDYSGVRRLEGELQTLRDECKALAK